MTITTVLHSPYTPGRPRAARPRLACELRPGPVSQSRSILQSGPGSENKSREPGPGPARRDELLSQDPGPVSRSRAEQLGEPGPGLASPG